jgi:hypothetical protein
MDSMLTTFSADWAEIRRQTLASKGLGECGIAAGLGECVVRQVPTAEVTTNMMATVIQALMAAAHIDATNNDTDYTGDAIVEGIAANIGLVNPMLPLVKPTGITGDVRTNGST